MTAIYFLVYRLLLHKETFFRLNRWFFLIGVISSFALPLLPVPQSWTIKLHLAEAAKPPATDPGVFGPVYTAVRRPVSAEVTLPASTAVTRPPKVQHRVAVKRHHEDPVPATAAPSPASAMTAAATPSPASAMAATTASSPASATTAASPTSAAPTAPSVDAAASAPAPRITLASVLQWLYYAYICGVLIFGVNLLLQFIVLWYQVRRNPIVKDGIFRIVRTRGNRAPCSFGKYIFINPDLYDEETYEQILHHEKIHVQQVHSLDIMLGEVCMVIQWFNPFAWYYRKALEDNLEFLTEASVISNPRFNASRYQISLLRVSAPHLPLSITSNYNQSLLKKRIVMMHVPPSSKKTTWKYAILLPLLLGMACFFNHSVRALAAEVTPPSTPLTVGHLNTEAFAQCAGYRPAGHHPNLFTNPVTGPFDRPQHQPQYRFQYQPQPKPHPKPKPKPRLEYSIRPFQFQCE